MSEYKLFCQVKLRPCNSNDLLGKWSRERKGSKIFAYIHSVYTYPYENCRRISFLIWLRHKRYFRHISIHKLKVKMKNIDDIFFPFDLIDDSRNVLSFFLWLLDQIKDPSIGRGHNRTWNSSFFFSFPLNIWIAMFLMITIVYIFSF